MSKKSTSINDFVGINAFGERLTDGTKMSHEEKYGTVVNAIGLEKCLFYVPTKLDKLESLLEEDEHLNNVPLRKWDAQHASFKYEMVRKGINSLSLSDTVCTLKAAAKMYVKGGK
jgi:hypothetical protein